MNECRYGGHIRSKLTVLKTCIMRFSVYTVAAVTSTDDDGDMKFLVITADMGETALQWHLF